MTPLELFNNWFAEEREVSNLNFPAACCLSTIGLDGYPNARFVSLKDVIDESLIITGSMGSRKGIEIEHCAKAALTFWWTKTERHIRIQGNVSRISKTDAGKYFEKRNRDSKIVSSIFQQGNPIQSINQMKETFDTHKKEIEDNDIIPPENWGGIAINPIRIEFMAFKKSRLHERTLYSKVDNQWTESILQP